MKAEPAKKPDVPCDVKDCETPWVIVVGVDVPHRFRKTKHYVKLCPKHYQEFKAGKSPTLKG